MKVLARFQARSKKTYVSTWDMAILYVALGRKEQAIASLEEGYQEHNSPVVYLAVDPRLDHLHSEVRFQQLLRRIGLQPESLPGLPVGNPAKASRQK